MVNFLVTPRGHLDMWALIDPCGKLNVILLLQLLSLSLLIINVINLKVKYVHDLY